MEKPPFVDSISERLRCQCLSKNKCKGHTRKENYILK
jgi:hypothetical protein